MQFRLIGTRTRTLGDRFEAVSYDKALQFAQSPQALGQVQDEELSVMYVPEPTEVSPAEIEVASQPEEDDTCCPEADVVAEERLFEAPFQLSQSDIERAVLRWTGAPDGWEARVMATTQSGEVIGPGQGQGGRIFAIVRPKGLGGG